MTKLKTDDSDFDLVVLFCLLQNSIPELDRSNICEVMMRYHGKCFGLFLELPLHNLDHMYYFFITSAVRHDPAV